MCRRLQSAASRTLWDRQYTLAGGYRPALAATRSAVIVFTCSFEPYSASVFQIMSRQEPVATTNVLVADDGWCSTCTVCGLAGNIMLCEFGCADADSRAVCSLAYHPACLGLSKAPKEQFVCPRHGRLSTIPARRLPQKVLALAMSCCIVLMRIV